MTPRHDLAPVAVWYAWVDPGQHSNLTRRYLGLLSEEEQLRHQRLRFERDRASYLAAHALLRMGLAEHTGQAPELWRFARAQHGKPLVAEPAHLRSLEFNLSHAAEVVACVVSAAGCCGIDVERTSDAPELKHLAQDHFTDQERSALEALDPAAGLVRFFDLWSLKEAYLKAQGIGLLGKPRSVSFRIEAGSVRAELEDTSWQFHLQAVAPDHRIAVAVRGRCAWPPVCRRIEL
jgi:4'-phosphopantetheinyl transferase